MVEAGEFRTEIYGLGWVSEGETVSFCSNAPAGPVPEECESYGEVLRKEPP